ncbi:MAG TPA: enoyl-CoA hydratase [Acidimicrobiales bacterium]|nr:enoyl-CoA hydratase [Acidimicrobiales bacterium]
MTFQPTTEDLVYEERDQVGWLTLNRPEARNAMTFEMYEGVADLCAQPLSELPKALVITGAGERAFAAGTDISQFVNFRAADDVFAYEARMSAVLSTVERCPVPTVAAIRGACTGGGAAIAAACDLRIGSPSAVFGVPIARTLGNCLSLDNYRRIAAIIGISRLKEIMFRARLVDATESLAIGWLHELVRSDGDLFDEAARVAAELIELAPLTLRATKKALLHIRDGFDEELGRDLVEMCYLSDDFHEGVDAFLNKRKPHWTGA